MRKFYFLVLVGLLSATMAAAQPRDVSGRVTDSNGQPVAGATVVVQGGSAGTVTDGNGNYSLRGVGAEAVLEINMLGFAAVTEATGGKTQVNVQLTPAAIDIEEVVMVGYGAVRKKDMTGSVTIVNAAQLEKEQPQTVQDLLRNNVAGLNIGYTDSAEGDVTDIVIRGKTNFRSNVSSPTRTSDGYNAPLIVLDDVIYYGRMTDINPADIESVAVLKDGSSSAIYGAKATNGVILITTKKGKEGKPVIRLDASVGLVMNARRQPSWSAGDEFLQFRSDASRLTSKAADIPANYYSDPRKMSAAELTSWMGTSSGDPMDIWLSRMGFTDVMTKNYKEGRSVNWKDYMFNDVALRQDYNLSVSGRTGDTRYYTSVGYTENKTNVKGSGYRAIKARVNLESRITDFLTYGINSQFANQDRSPLAVGTGYTSLTPYDSVYEEDGVTLKQTPSGGGWVSNPLLANRYTDRLDNTSVLNATGFLRVTLPFGFSVESRYSPYFSWNQNYIHQSSENPLWNGTTNNYVRRNNNNYFRWQWDNLLKWNKSFGKHAFDFTYLMNLEQQKDWLNSFQGNDFLPNDDLGWHGIKWATTVTAVSDANLDRVRNSDAIMARLNYTFANRYTATASFRRDGDAAFGQANPRANFFAGALAWTFTEESFWPKNDWFTYGKLRFSYGENGNRDVGLYASQMTVNTNKYIYINGDGTESLINSFYAERMSNRLLKWEKTTSYNLALDFALLRDRISGTIDIYKKLTNDLVVSRALPTLTGYASVTSNIGEVQNTGIELSITSRNFVQKNFKWDTQFNFSHNKNRINALYGELDANGKPLDDITNKRFIGKSMDEIWDYRVLGVWQESEKEEAAKYGRRPGDFKLDKEDWENTKYTETEDKQFLGSKTPLYRLSLRNSFTVLQNLTFSFNLYSYLGYYKEFNRAKNDDANMATAAVGQPKGPYWTPENPSNKYGRLGSSSTQGFSYWWRADFVKIDNISVAYDVPKRLLSPLKIQSLNVSATLKNGILMSRWPGEDPEGASPIYLYFGLNTTF